MSTTDASGALLLIGKFKRKYINNLDFDACFYENVEEGSRLIVYMFNVFNIIDLESLARALGINNIYDMSQVTINRDRIDLDELEALPCEEKDFHDFLALWEDKDFELMLVRSF